jgi:ribosome-binding protein aMBF1 (putative translation factor)
MHLPDLGRKCRGLLRTFYQVLPVRRVSGENDPDGILPKVGGAIRRARNEAGLSQEALADASEIDRSHLGRIERGERNLTILNLKKIANALERSAWDLLKDASI